MKYILIASLLNLVVTMTNYTQELGRHKWEDRLILILSNDSSNKSIQTQLDELTISEDDLVERKLVIYTVFPSKYKTVFPDTNSWSYKESLYNSYKDTDSSFELVLIGLDGGVKLRKTEIITAGEIFSVIDQMYMRRKEIERNNSN